MKRFIPILIITFSICGTAWAGAYEDGLAAFQRGDLATALKKYQTAAGNGNAGAQLNLGMMYDTGTGVKKNYKKAMQEAAKKYEFKMADVENWLKKNPKPKKWEGDRYSWAYTEMPVRKGVATVMMTKQWTKRNLIR